MTTFTLHSIPAGDALGLASLPVPQPTMIPSVSTPPAGTAAIIAASIPSPRRTPRRVLPTYFSTLRPARSHLAMEGAF